MNNNNWPYPFQNNAMMPYNMNPEIRNLENRIYNLEREVARIKRTILTAEKNQDYSSNYKPNSYNMM